MNGADAGPAWPGPGPRRSEADLPAGDTAAVTGGPTGDTAAVAGGPTGHPAVDAALEQLERADELPPAAQVAAYEAAHRALLQTLATIDQG